MSQTNEQTADFLGSIGISAGEANAVQEKAAQQGQYAEYALAALYPDAVDFPGTQAYGNSVKLNWSSLARRDASAIFHPSSPEEVAKALELLEFFGQEFAIRGGGHSPNPGWASIQNGLLISTDRLTHLNYDEASKTVSIGAGNKWGTVYKYLEKFGVLVTGGHSSPVGCVGQITGCGNSPWFHKYGWSCDNVMNFEIVTSGGKILNASKDENPDLWWALKGGSNNFGIVTRMDMSSIPMPDGVWGGEISWEWSPEIQRQTAEAFYKFQIEGISEDPGVETISGWGKEGSKKFIKHVLSADRNVPAGGHPKAMDGLFALNPTALVGNCKPSELAAHDDLSMGGYHQSVYFSENTRSQMLCLTVKADLDYFQEAVNIFYDEYEQSHKTKDAIICLNLSPIAARTIQISNERGGTAPGWAVEEQTLVFLDNAWLREEDDEIIFSMGKRCIARLRAAAKARGVLMPQVWMNNAGRDDDVIASYGKKNWVKLRDISIKYDPKRTFQRLCVGGYKIERK
ncbi:hypothetical protein ACJ41O_003417 [Fusarium nematophilum]